MKKNVTAVRGLCLCVAAVLWSVNAAALTWFDGRGAITYSVAKDADPVVMTALEMWKDDMRQVTGFVPVPAKRAVIRIVQGHGADDGFRLYVNDGQLVVEGHNARGTAYGILELSRLAGVSPWIWWGDIVPEHRDTLVIDDAFAMEHTPSVAYRGIFINDEDWSLRPWSRFGGGLKVEGGVSIDSAQGLSSFNPPPSTLHPKETPIPPSTYRRIFELLLRLRANTVWPAMHEGTVAFFQTPGAKAAADSCGIVIGTSHCEPLLRNNVGEWNTEQRGRFNYKTNREAVQQYWTERLKELFTVDSLQFTDDYHSGSEGLAGKSTVNRQPSTVNRQLSTVNRKLSTVNRQPSTVNYIFTIGMRGIHDSSMEGYQTDQEKFDALQQVIDDQQGLIRRYVGDPAKQMQMFAPYKEVLQLYEMGLRVPDYVTLMWCDDNYGYVTRYSSPVEQQRQGGAGVYYHLSYWGRPHDYLWLTTTQPGLIYNEMREAYDHNVRRLWIANVHDPKVAGYQLELFLDMAWDIDCVSGSTLCDHYRSWLCRQFGPEAGRRLFPAMHEFYRLSGERRPEFMGWTQVELDKKRYPRGLSPVDSIGMTALEAADRMAAFERVKAGVIESRPYVRPELADAFFAAIEYPVYASAAMSRKILSDSAESHRAYEEIQSLTAQYNNMQGGKWRGLMDAAPRRLPVFEDVRGILRGERGEVRGERIDLLRNIPLTSHLLPLTSETTSKIQMLGHSMLAVRLPKGDSLVSRFPVATAGDYRLRIALIPTHAVDSGDIRFSVSIDGEPTVFSLKEPFRSEQWKQNVLRGQALRCLSVSLAAGEHTLTIRALDEHIVIDQCEIISIKQYE